MKVGIGQLVMALAAGAGVGVFYFGGLWLTVRRVARSRRPTLLTFGSFIVRAAAAVTVIVLIARIHWQLAVASMLGFVLARVALVGALRPRPAGAGATLRAAPPSAGATGPTDPMGD